MKAIPTSWYFDNGVYELEQEFLFSRYPQYKGHQLMVPNPHDFYVLQRENKGKMLVNQKEYYSLLSNVCCHHEALLMEDKGNADKIVCPAHRWCYDLNGHLLHAPRFDKVPCVNLSNQRLEEWLGMLFLGNNMPLPQLEKEISTAINFSNYRFYKMIEQHYDFNWKIFMEVYLDNYHIPAIHPGLRNVINIDEQSWIINKEYSAQLVKIKESFNKAGSAAYEKYQRLIMDYQDKIPRADYITWFSLYPATMIECYPYMLLVSTVKPISATECVNYMEYYFDVDMLQQAPEFAEIAIAAYSETAQEDNHISELINNGRRSLYEEGKDQAGPHHPQMEKGLDSFYAFLHHIR
ncbi:MAG: aromatic ring-hydroxylating oxygenase subunit alpha [Legionella sp.]